MRNVIYCVLYISALDFYWAPRSARLIHIIQLFIFSLLNTKLQYCLIVTHYALNFKGSAPVEFGDILQILASLTLHHCRTDSNLSFLTYRTRIYTNIILAILFASTSSSIIGWRSLRTINYFTTQSVLNK